MSLEERDVISVRFPAAHPGAYLRWMAHWEELDRALLDHPSHESLASMGSAPFVREPVAEFLLQDLIPQVKRQAASAEREGRPLATPRVRGDRDMLAEGVGFVIRQTRWIDEPGVAAALGIRPLRPELARLRDDALRAVQARLRTARARRTLTPAGR